ncbi:hypothetical protein FMV2238Y02_09490 [Streptococcus canis]|uniref:Uncharacterized protein n=1 Tax=Streptococcus canis TaxID=1329 RepID=A0A3P5XPM2_STRCB|nr:hypothetical protein FMV2238Y02_09490 [Streptococcus canis]
MAKKSATQAKQETTSQKADSNKIDNLKRLISDHQSSASQDSKGLTSKAADKGERLGQLSKFKDSNNDYHLIAGLSTFVIAALGLVLGRKKLFK